MKRFAILITIAACTLMLAGCLSLPVGTDSVIIDPQPTPYHSPVYQEETPRRVTPEPKTPEPFYTPSESAKATPIPTVSAPSVEQQPPLLAQALEESGLTFESLTGNQLVMVYSHGGKSQVYCYGRENDVWQLNRNISYLRAYVGKNGLNQDKKEGDGTTPSGLFSLVFAFGHAAEADTKMEYRQITEGTYWVNDPESALYNQWTQQKGEGIWSYAEDLHNSGVRYNIAFVVGYNYGEDMVPGAGSGIFLHCGDYATDGGICMKEVNMRKLAAWLDQTESPQILIAGDE